MTITHPNLFASTPKALIDKPKLAKYPTISNKIPIRLEKLKNYKNKRKILKEF